jgi:hypothetical protein
MASQTPAAVAAGVLLMAVVTEGTTPMNAATRANVTAWVSGAMAPYSMTQDADGMPLETYFGRSRDTFITINLRTMTIEDIRSNDAAGAVTDAIALAGM